MKVLMVIDSLTAGGKERRLVQLLKGLKLHEKDILCELIVLSDRIHYQEVYTIGYKLHVVKRNPAQDPRAFIKIFRIAKKFGPDIIQSWDSMGSVYAMPVAKVIGAKFINAMIVAAPKKLKPFGNLWIRSKLTFPFSDVILANSRAGLKAFNQTNKKSRCIHNGIDLSRFDRAFDNPAVREKFTITTPKVVGMVAALSFRKDYATYLKVAKNIVEERKDTTFLCIGDGEQREQLEGGLTSEERKYIVFTGRQTDVESIVNCFDVGVLSSFDEGISNSVIEYMCLAKPVVSTDAGGMVELIEDGHSGFVVPIQASEAMKEKICYLLDDQSKAQQMGQNGLEIIKERFSLAKMTNNFVKLYSELLGDTFL